MNSSNSSNSNGGAGWHTSKDFSPVVVHYIGDCEYHTIFDDGGYYAREVPEDSRANQWAGDMSVTYPNRILRG